jgi:hypothetical protein
MIRFAWLQSRTQTLIATAALSVVAAAAAITGVHLSHLYSSLVAHCHGDCGVATGQFLSHDSFLQNALTLLMRITPALLGIFWGAPLLTREFETGTYRLAWTQSVSRSRWLATRLTLVGLATLAIAGLLSFTVTWWFRAIDTVGTNQYSVFDGRDIAPIGYALFAVTLGAATGAVIRRTVPAMATTLAVFVFVRVAILEWVRPHLLAPLHKSVSLLSADQLGFASSNGSSLALVARAPAPPNAWALSSQLVTNSGQPVSAAANTAFLRQYCPTIALPPTGPTPGQGVARTGDATAFEACRNEAAHMFHLVATYQPASRYWTFQWLETGIFLALALAASAACYWWVTQRTA